MEFIRSNWFAVVFMKYQNLNLYDKFYAFLNEYMLSLNNTQLLLNK